MSRQVGFSPCKGYPTHQRTLSGKWSCKKKFYPHATCKIQPFSLTFLPFSHSLNSPANVPVLEYSFRMKIPLSTPDHWTQPRCEKSLPCPNICQFRDIRSQSQQSSITNYRQQSVASFRVCCERERSQDKSVLGSMPP